MALKVEQGLMGKCPKQMWWRFEQSYLSGAELLKADIKCRSVEMRRVQLTQALRVSK